MAALKGFYQDDAKGRWKCHICEIDFEEMEVQSGPF